MREEGIREEKRMCHNPEEKLPVKVGYINGVHVNDIDVPKT
jgi:hypothetical protein